jgi:integrase
MSLTAKRIDKLLKAPGRYLDSGDDGVKGLHLQVTPGGASWLLRYEIEATTLRDGTPSQSKRGRRDRWMGLGSYKDFSLKEARVRAKEKRQLLADGVDPLALKAAARTAKALAAAKEISFEKAARQYFAEHSKEGRNEKHRQQFISTLEMFAFPVIGALPIGSIDKILVLKVLEQKHVNYPDQRLWDAVPETASRLRGRIERVLGWAAMRDYRSGENPARWKDYLSHTLTPRSKIPDQKIKHHPALSYNDVGEFFADLRKREGVVAAALEFTILTAARTGDTIGARWDEIELRAVPVTTQDEEGQESTIMGPCWIVPADRIKGGKRHRVPLSDRAVEILKVQRDGAAGAAAKGNPFVFQDGSGDRQGKGLADLAMLQLLQRQLELPVTVHGFRSTFRDWAAESSNHPREVIEKALAHGVKDKSEASYWRSDMFDKRRRLMNDWAKYCGSPKCDASVADIKNERRKRGG